MGFRIRYGYCEFVVKPFGSTNAPIAFMNLMNDVFRENLDKCAIVLIDDPFDLFLEYREHDERLRIVY